MYYYLNGTLALKDKNTAVVDCGGVGYKLTISSTAMANLPSVGEPVKLYTHLLVKEDSMDLIGFIDQAEKSAFLMLISVSGVGLKVAMSVLSALSAERFAFAVARGDHKEISIAHGVSTKTAQKIIIELKDKISKEELSQKSASAADYLTSGVSVQSDVLSDALEALIVLGFNKNEALSALRGIDTAQPLETVLKTALKILEKI